MVCDEDEAEEQQGDHFPAQAHPGHQGDVGEGHDPGVLQEAGLLNAQEAQDGPQEQG